MLVFGMAYEEIEKSNTITFANGKSETYKIIEHKFITIEPVSKKDLRYGYVKTDQTQIKDIEGRYLTSQENTWFDARLYDLVDIETGYVLARTFKTDLKEAIRLIDEYGFLHTENGKYRAPNGFEINSKKQYKQGLLPIA